jgi:hypothetical protein
MVAFLIREAEEPLLEDRISPVPQGQRKTEILMPVADTSEPIFIPTICL